MANLPAVAWYGAGHPSENTPCPTCNATPAANGAPAPCVSVVPSFGAGAVGIPLRGLHAARVRVAFDAASMPGAARGAA